MNLDSVLTPVSDPGTDEPYPVPAGYQIFVARKWGDPILVAEAGLSTALFRTSNFQVVPVYVPETRTFSATAGNSSRYDRARGDMDAIWAWQPKDGRTQTQVFGKIVFAGNFECTMWTGDPAKDWSQASEWIAGSMLYGGQQFAATVETFEVLCKLPGHLERELVTCRKVYPFRREHFALTHAQAPWLVNKYTVAFRRPVEDTYSEIFDPGIERYLPMQVLDPQDFEFAGGLTPSAFYIPIRWCLPVGMEQ